MSGHYSYIKQKDLSLETLSRAAVPADALQIEIDHSALEDRIDKLIGRCG